MRGKNRLRSNQNLLAQLWLCGCKGLPVTGCLHPWPVWFWTHHSHLGWVFKDGHRTKKPWLKHLPFAILKIWDKLPELESWGPGKGRHGPKGRLLCHTHWDLKTDPFNTLPWLTGRVQLGFWSFASSSKIHSIRRANIVPLPYHYHCFTENHPKRYRLRARPSLRQGSLPLTTSVYVYQTMF